MRLTLDQIELIRNSTKHLAGESATVRLFGSRVRDDARGGDVDLLIEIDRPVENAALLAAQVSARISYAMQGRNVDVVIRAPNLLIQPIHTVALTEGILL